MNIKISNIQWSELQHAYGSASDVPALLTKVAANDAKAMTKLGDTIAHQGWLSPDF